jgi:hypothetical protein
MRLYELQDQLMAIDNILESNTNSETQEILESAKEELLTAINGKCENILDFIDDCKCKIDQLKERELNLAKKRRILENKIVYLKNMMLWYMKTNNITKESFGDWNLTVAKTAGRVVLDACDDAFPDCFKKWTFDIDKTALKEQMKDGQLIFNGKMLAHIEEGESLRIK